MSLPFRRAKPSVLAALAMAALMLFRMPAFADGRFVDGIEDLPLMPELQSVPAASVDFDGLAGRIVVAFAEGTVAMEDVRAFYDATLPQLGWAKQEGDRWVRAGEELSFDAVAERGGLVVRFELVPR